MRRLGVLRGAICLALVAALGDCSGSGPLSPDVKAGQVNPEGQPFAVRRITPDVIKVLAKAAPRLAGEFRDQTRPGNIHFGIGDLISVTIFEAGSGGLFIPAEAGVRPGNFVTIPTQAVDERGNISIPYAGTIRAQGRTKGELQDTIVNALKNRAIEPQVVVTRTTQETSMINVVGDVLRPGRIPALAAGEKLLDTISRAGGPRGQGPDEWIMLDRGGRRAMAPFGSLLYEPSNNIYAHADDTIFLYREPQTFLALGSVSLQRQLPFDAWRITLAEAIAKAGGLIDSQSDPNSVFLYRGETRETAEALGIETSQYQGPVIPVVYNLNLRDGAGLFLATEFEMRNKDVIYVSTSAAVEMAKFRAMLQTVYGTATDPMQSAITFYTLKNIASGTGAVPGIVSGGGGGGGSTTIITPPASP